MGLNKVLKSIYNKVQEISDRAITLQKYQDIILKKYNLPFPHEKLKKSTNQMWDCESTKRKVDQRRNKI